MRSSSTDQDLSQSSTRSRGGASESSHSMRISSPNGSARRRRVSNSVSQAPPEDKLDTNLATGKAAAAKPSDKKNSFFESKRSIPTPDRPIHVSQDSLFSSSSGYTNYRGYLNLALLLLVLACSRVALENLIKYGILINPVQWFSIFMHKPYQVPNLALMFISNVFILTSLFIETKLARQQISERTGTICTIINLTVELLLPVACVVGFRTHPIPSCFTLGIYVCIFLKLISYAHVNYWCRTAAIAASQPKSSHHSPKDRAKSPELRHSSTSSNNMNGNWLMYGKRDALAYPDNLTVHNIYYFMVAPTLCYELNFPRSPAIRKWFVLKRSVEAFLLTLAMMALIQQWLVPAVRNSIRPLVEMDIGRMVERLLKLAIPSHIVWQIFFYWLFHSILNLNAELLRFADRAFYRDWWNAETMNYFWQAWNIPVHRWAVRHVYKPMMRHGYSQAVCATFVFFISAFFHEYLISVPLTMFRLWAFVGMLSQIPLSFITGKLIGGGKLGNVIVWLSLILGQPLCVVMYFHDYYLREYPQASLKLNETDFLPEFL